MRAIVLLLALAMLPVAAASSLSADVWPQGSVDIRVSLTTNTVGKDTISIPAPEPQFVSVHDDQRTLRFAVLSDGVVVRPGRSEDQYPLELRYQTAALTTKDGMWTLRLPLGSLSAPAGAIVAFPKGAMLHDYDGEPVVYTEDGRIHLGWRFEDAVPEAVTVTYTTGPPARALDAPALAIAAAAVALLTIFTRRAYDHHIRKRSSGQKAMLDALEQHERTVMDALLGEKKEMTQAHLSKVTGLSKASVSRMVKRLSEKGMVTSARMGSATLVGVSREFRKR